MSGTKLRNELIEQFTDPVFMLNKKGELAACNLAFEQHPVLSQWVAELLLISAPLMVDVQERVLWTKENVTLILTVLPMTQQFWLIKCHPAQSSALTQRYQNLIGAIDQLSEAMLICNETNQIELVNAPIQQLFPYIPLVSYRGMPILTFARHVLEHLEHITSRRKKAVLRWINRKMQRKESCQLRFTNNDGRYLEYRDRITHNGERIGLIIDESDFRALHEQLLLACEHSTNLSQAKSNFMAAMSHEVRTPLSAMIGMLDLCMQEPGMASNEFLQRSQHNAVHLLQLVNDVLDFTQFEVEKVVLAPVPIKIRALCERLIESFAAQAMSSKTRMSLFVSPTLPQILELDDMRLGQILSNLLSNALKFSSASHPIVSLSVAECEQPNCVRFSIRDNGIGISADQQRIIFNDFTQASPGTHREFGGSGLGLSICQRICTLMGCELHLESELTRGAHFYFDLPVTVSGETDLQQFDLSLAAGLTLLTNDPDFYATLAPYAEFIGFQCHQIDTITPNLSAQEYVFYLPHKSDQHRGIPSYWPGHTAILCDTKIASLYPEFVQIQRSPLKLTKLMDFIGVTNTQQQVQSSNGISHHNSGLSRTLHALVIEDNRDNMFVLRKQFAALDIQARFATHPEEAIIYFEQENFDIIISDYQMPGMSGAELIRTLREIETHKQRKVAVMLVLTADKTQHCHQDCMAANADEVMFKPLRLDALSKLLDATAKTHGSAAISSPSTDTFFSAKSLEETTSSDFLYIEPTTDRPSRHLTSPSEQLTDLSVLIDCLGEIDDEERREFLLKYSQNLLINSGEMRAAMTDQHWKTLQRLAHSLKGSALIIGAHNLSKECAKIEQLLSQKNSAIEQQIAVYWRQTENTISQVYQELQTELGISND
ncbi:MAG: two-component system sensor histidine kinase BarA [Paraglaciecola sp.]